MTSSIIIRADQGKLSEVACEIFADQADFDLSTITAADFYIKTSQTTPDSDPATILLSTGTGDITVSGPVATVQILAVHVPVAGTFWYHLDILTSGAQTRTAASGPFIVEAV